MSRAMPDLEASTFQKRPAYRYIRAADKLPTVDEARRAETPMALIKLFHPSSAWTWYIAGYDPDTREAWGIVRGQEWEVGTVSMQELVELRADFGRLPIERDLYWTPVPVFEIAGKPELQ